MVEVLGWKVFSEEWFLVSSIIHFSYLANKFRPWVLNLQPLKVVATPGRSHDDPFTQVIMMFLKRKGGLQKCPFFSFHKFMNRRHQRRRRLNGPSFRPSYPFKFCSYVCRIKDKLKYVDVSLNENTMCFFQFVLKWLQFEKGKQKNYFSAQRPKGDDFQENKE